MILRLIRFHLYFLEMFVHVRVYNMYYMHVPEMKFTNYNALEMIFIITCLFQGRKLVIITYWEIMKTKIEVVIQVIFMTPRSYLGGILFLPCLFVCVCVCHQL